MALKSDWKEIDQFLTSEGFNLRTVFRINSTDSSYKTWRSQRSAIVYEAFKALILGPWMPHGERKTRLELILQHLDTDMMGLLQAREDLVAQMEAIVQDNLKAPKGPLIEDAHTKAKILWGTQVCYRGCGKYYHFSVKCCPDIHTMKFGEFETNYVVVQDQIFLDKCAVFGLMKKINVVKSGDYRSVDKFLQSKNMSPTEHFLTESNGNQRRTHLSFNLTKMLADSDFIEVKEAEKEVKNFIDYVESNYAMLKSKCEKFDCKNEIPKFEMPQDEESSSSGIESGDSGSSGKCSPVQLDHGELPSDSQFHEKMLDFDLRLSLDNDHLYVDLRDLQPLVGLDYSEMLKILKRRYRSVDVDNSFPCKKFKPELKYGFSLKCFNLMLAKNYVKICQNLDKNVILAELDHILAKYSKEAFDDEEDFEIIDDNEIIVEETKNQNFVTIGDFSVLFLATGRDLFLERKPLMRKYFSLSQCCNYAKMDAILQESGLNPKTAFLFRGRSRSFISVAAFKALIQNEYYDLKSKSNHFMNFTEI